MGTEKPINTCFLLGAGEIEDFESVTRQIPQNAFILCADGGYNYCEKLGITPDLLMGDFDSIGRELPQGIPRIDLPTAKNFTDTAFAVEEAYNRGCRTILMSGMLGGRLDHTIGNLQTLAHCAKIGMDARITDGKTDVYALAAHNGHGEITIAPKERHYFSLLSMVDCCRGVTIQNGEYPLDDYPLSSLEARAVSNEFTGRPVRVTLTEGVLLIIVTPKR